MEVARPTLSINTIHIHRHHHVPSTRDTAKYSRLFLSTHTKREEAPRPNMHVEALVVMSNSTGACQSARLAALAASSGRRRKVLLHAQELIHRWPLADSFSTELQPVVLPGDLDA